MPKSLGLNERDILLLKFLWRWKVSTAATLSNKFFSENSKKWAYNRMYQLRTAGYIRIISDPVYSKHVCTLDKKGFDIILPHLPPLEEVGYRSENICHDIIASAVHLGDWLLETPKEVSLFSERELRSYHSDFYPKWVPHPVTRRSDGYWRVPSGQKMATIALEVELTAKHNVDYEIIGEFYANRENIYRVVWVTSTISLMKRVEENIRKAIGTKTFIHDFITFEDFKKFGWQSEFIIGPEAGKTLAYLLGSNLGKSEGRVPHFSLLDIRKTPLRSDTCRLLEIGDFSD